VKDVRAQKSLVFFTKARKWRVFAVKFLKKSAPVSYHERLHSIPLMSLQGSAGRGGKPRSEVTLEGLGSNTHQTSVLGNATRFSTATHTPGNDIADDVNMGIELQDPIDKIMEQHSLALASELQPEMLKMPPKMSPADQFDYSAIAQAAVDRLVNGITEPVTEFCILFCTAVRFCRGISGSVPFDFNSAIEIVQSNLLRSLKSPVEDFCSTMYAAKRIRSERRASGE
jgi:hypothetical protein